MEPYWSNERHGLSIYHGDCLAIMPQLGKEFDLCLTDPPYLQENIDAGIYELTGHVASMALRDGGSLVSFAPHIHLREALEGLSKHLMFHWVLCHDQRAGARCAMWSRRVWPAWKPLLWFVKGVYVGNWMRDVVESRREKDGHPWQQGTTGLEDIIMKFRQSHTVLDPFLGSGTTLVACYRLGRQGVGIEISEEYCELAARRLEREIAQGRLFEPAEIAQEKPSQLAFTD